MDVHFISQLNYPNLPYCTDTDTGGLPEEKNTIAVSGCGVCCFMMCVEACTGKRIPIEKVIEYATESGATRHYGTDFDVLLAYALPKYGMEFETTNDINHLKEWVLKGGVAVANTGGDRDGYSCPFSPRGHYIFVREIIGDKCFLFDTSFRPEKYTKASEEGEVVVREDNTVIASLDFLDKACDNKCPRYCLVK